MTPFFRRRAACAPLCLPLALAIFASGCEEAAKPAGPAAPIGLAQLGRPATPGPSTVATPRREPATEVATPPPATPVPAVTPTPSPVPLSELSPPPSPSASPSGSPRPTPSPGPTASPAAGTVQLTVSGPGYLVLSTKALPLGAEDLLFASSARLTLRSDPGGSLPAYRLRTAEHGFEVVGFARSGGAPADVPGEAIGDGGVTLTTTWGGQPTAALGLALDAERNPGAAEKLGFDFTGRLQLGGAAPRGQDGTAVQAFVAIAQFESPSELVAAPGIPGIFRYVPQAGDVTLGVAVSGTGRVVGNQNLIIVGAAQSP